MQRPARVFRQQGRDNLQGQRQSGAQVRDLGGGLSGVGDTRVTRMGGPQGAVKDLYRLTRFEDLRVQQAGTGHAQVVAGGHDRPRSLVGGQQGLDLLSTGNVVDHDQDAAALLGILR